MPRVLTWGLTGQKLRVCLSYFGLGLGVIYTDLKCGQSLKCYKFDGGSGLGGLLD